MGVRRKKAVRLNSRERRFACVQRLGGGVATALLLLAATLAAGDEAPTLRVEYGGCRTVLKGPVCVLGEERALRLWVSTAPDMQIEIMAGSTPLEPAVAVDIQHGMRFQLEVPADATLLVVRFHDQQGAIGAWQIALAEEARPLYLSRASALLQDGRLNEARALLEDALTSATLEQHANAVGLLGRILNQQGRIEPARDALRAAAAENVRDGRLYDALLDTAVLVFSLMHKGRFFTEARALLEGFPMAWQASAEARYYQAYFLGLVAFNSGDVRDALRELDTAADQAARFGWDRLQLNAEEILAVQLQLLGRRDEAAALLRGWVDRPIADQPPCERALFLTNLGWSELLVLEAGETTGDPTAVLKRAYETLDKHCSVDDRMNGLVNLALAQLHARRLPEAVAYLARARAQTATPELRFVLWALDIEARIALAEGRAQQALTAYVQLEALAAATLSPSARWRAAVGVATAHAALGDDDAAIDAFARADAQLNQDILQVPFYEGRELLLASRAEATKHHLALLLAADRTGDAFRVARRSRSRMMHSLLANPRFDGRGNVDRGDWDSVISAYQALHDELVQEMRLGWALPKDQLPLLIARRERREYALRQRLDSVLAGLGAHEAPRAMRAPVPGEVLVTFHALPQGWVVFAHDGTNLVARRRDCGLGDTGPNALAACLLDGVSELLLSAPLVRILSSGALRSVDFHALRVGDDVLLDAAPVVYGLDLAPAAEIPSPATHALLVADPHGNLAATRQEVRAVQRILGDGGQWTFDRLETVAADSATVRRRLQQADLFHFAGHAQFLGSRGWDSELRLARHSSLDVSDILALGRVPSLVVLSGCETAMSAQGPAPESIGLAHAFLVKGSRTVVAAVRPVQDVSAYALMETFYEQWSQGEPPAQALRNAQLELRRRHPKADWSAFRLMGP